MYIQYHPQTYGPKSPGRRGHCGATGGGEGQGHPGGSETAPGRRVGRDSVRDSPSLSMFII